jgi:hypothetical protein
MAQVAARHGSCPWRRSTDHLPGSKQIVSSHRVDSTWLRRSCCSSRFQLFHWPMGAGGHELSCYTGLCLPSTFLIEYSRLHRSIFLALYTLAGMHCSFFFEKGKTRLLHRGDAHSLLLRKQ